MKRDAATGRFTSGDGNRTAEHNATIGASLRARGRGQSPTKVCPRCGEEKPREEFGRRPNGHSKTYCPPCWKATDREKSKRHWDNRPDLREQQRATNRKARLKQYGITPEAYDAMLEAQGGVCAICGGEQTLGRKHFDVDHCHDTGIVRGLLCSHCNRALGLMLDDPSRLRGAAAYLERVAS